MNIVSPTHKVKIVLKRHQLLSLREAQPRLAIACKDGVLWITNSNDHRDCILGAGTSFSPQCKGNVVIEALRDAFVDIEER
jgi:hypothetical protein